MVFRIRIKLQSTNVKHLDEVAKSIVEIARKSGVTVKGPVPLPTKRLEVPIFRLPHGEGSKYWDHFEMTIHKRLIDIDADERVMRRLIRLQVPDDVAIEIKQRGVGGVLHARSTGRRSTRSRRSS
ncbi:MAG: 30S ribosomal protein S10 [Desulfurococcales archaeon]|nr:30S ribosomal protein S10 [Desulfurococcales archaeon]